MIPPVFLFLLLLAVPAFAASPNVGKEPDNFRGIPWGQEMQNIKGIEKLGEEFNGHLWVCKRKDDKMHIGPAQLEGILYFFIDNKFAEVIISTAGKANADLLLGTLRAAYGEGTRFEENTTWLFPSVSITYNFDQRADKATVYYSYRSLREQLNKTLEREQRDGVKDL